MAEILTESFCERCGTRYTFEAATPKKHRIGRLKVLSKGLKNYVLSDDASLDEALADARSEEERELSGGQLDAFHQTFQFCMSCRQYTCSNCWNEAEGRCLSCAPLSLTGNAQLGSPLDDLLARGGMSPVVNPVTLDGDPGAATNGTTNGQHAHDETAEPGSSAWPTIDLFRTAGSAPADDAARTVPEAVAEILPEAVAADADDAPAAQAEAELSEPADFWTKPFTGFAPVPEPTNGHAPAAPAPEPGPDESPSVEAVVETEPATPVAGELPAAAAPDVAAEAPGPLAVEAPMVEADETPVATESAEPVATQAPGVDPAAEARAAELAERTTRLLGRLRVQPRSAGSAPAPTQDEPNVAAAATQAPAPAQSPAPAQAPTPAPAWPRLQPQPSRTPVQPAASRPAPVDEPALTPFDKLVERPAPPAWMKAAAAAVPVTPAPEPVEAAAPQPEPEPIVEPVAEPIAEAIVEPAATVPVEAATPAEPAVAEPTAPATDRVEMPAWPRLVRPPLSDLPPVQAPPAPMPTQAPQWPAPLQPGYDASSTPFWASGDSGRVAGELDVWTASAREVAEAPGQTAGVQSCVKCGLSLSATARFCRRCGSRQG